MASQLCLRPFSVTSNFDTRELKIGPFHRETFFFLLRKIEFDWNISIQYIMCCELKTCNIIIWWLPHVRHCGGINNNTVSYSVQGFNVEKHKFYCISCIILVKFNKLILLFSLLLIFLFGWINEGATHIHKIPSTIRFWFEYSLTFIRKERKIF